jgi:glucans biosynthesis protein C
MNLGYRSAAMSSSTAPAATSERFHAFDNMRATAMFLGVVYHSLFSFSPDMRGYYVASDVTANLFATWLADVIFGFRMQLFFMIGGFFGGLLVEKYGVQGFVANRFRRIVIPFLVTSCLFLLAERGVELYAVKMGTIGADWPDLQDWTPRPLYLWFLFYLSMIDACTVLSLISVRRLAVKRSLAAVDRFIRWLIKTPWKPLLLAIPAGALLATEPRMQYFDYVPVPAWVAYYALYFGFGWMLYRHKDLRPDVARHRWIYLALGLALSISLAFMSDAEMAAGTTAFKLLSLGRRSIVGWLMMLGILGVFVHHFDRPNPRVRFLSDSTYWAYLIHYPLVMLGQITVAQLPLPFAVKLPLIVLGVTGIALVTYRYFVRYTFIGRTLNGPRERPSTAPPVSATL